MLTSDELVPVASAVAAEDGPTALSNDLKSLLERAHGMQFTILDGPTGELLDAPPGQPSRDWSAHAEVCREVARRGNPEFIEDEDPFLTLALPLLEPQGSATVAVGVFLTRRVDENEDLSSQASRLGMKPDEAIDWARSYSTKHASEIAWGRCKKRPTICRSASLRRMKRSTCSAVLPKT